jgi:hypothetical protein
VPICVSTCAKILLRARNPEGMIPRKCNNSGPFPRNTLGKKRVYPEMKGQQRIRCMTAAKTRGSYMVRSILSETGL